MKDLVDKKNQLATIEKKIPNMGAKERAAFPPGWIIKRRESEMVKSFGLIVGIGICILLLGSPSFAAGPGNLSLGVYGGWAWGTADEGIEGYPHTEFDDGWVYGGSLIYRLPGGLALGVSLEHLEMDLKEFGESYGKIKMTPLMFNILYQGIPVGGRGLTGHGGIGLGVNFTSFDKGPATRPTVSVDTEDDFVFAIYGGFDYFFSRNISLNLDGRFLLGTVDSTWREYGFTLPIGEFNIHNFQLLLGLRLWF
ncbi:MAG: hypothetical protein H6Q43_1437 [Deltaproteobacteria bacterium]|nr:hypothetical protein [Deltaproteobacteria bacterium]